MRFHKTYFTFLILSMFYIPSLSYAKTEGNQFYLSPKNTFQIKSPFDKWHTTVAGNQGKNGEGLIFLYDDSITTFGRYEASWADFENLEKTPPEKIQLFYQWITSRYQKNLNLRSMNKLQEKTFDYYGNLGYQLLYQAEYPGEEVSLFSKRVIYLPVVVLSTFYPFENGVVIFDLIIFPVNISNPESKIPWERYNKFVSSFRFTTKSPHNRNGI